MVNTGQRALDEGFYRLLTEGSDLLQRGAIADARARIERALELNPHHEQALNLLGLALFRLGQFEHARLIFSDLVNNNPIEASLRLNLAMVHLKTSHLDEAQRELEEVLAINPDHPRATSYMGLVLERKGELEGAAAFYERAGNTQRAEEIRAHRPSTSGTFPLLHLQNLMQQARAQDAIRAAVAPPVATRDEATSPPGGWSAPPTAALASAASPAVTPSAAASHVTSSPVMPAVPALAAQAYGVALPADPPMPPPVAPQHAALPPTPPRAPTPVRAPRLSGESDTDSEEAAFHLHAPPPAEVEAHTLADLRARAARAAFMPPASDGLVAIPVETASYVRSDLTVAVSGGLELEPVYRRYRGKRTDSLFGGADAALVALSGQGVALLAVDKLELLWLALRGEELYLVEPVLLGFTHGLVWENGRLPSDADRDLDIVHLRGSGRLVLGTRARVVSMVVTPEAPALVAATRLVGWTGQLVPQRVPLPGLSEAARRVPAVRFDGSGLVLAF